MKNVRAIHELPLQKNDMQKENHHRHSIRLKNYDYSSFGAYFVTICTEDKGNVLCKINNNTIELNDFGRIVEECWRDLPKHYDNVELDELIIMPNHLHFIIIIKPKITADCRGLINQTPTNENQNWILMKNQKTVLGKIVRYFKARSTRLIKKRSNQFFAWQRNYYEHIIRGEKQLNAIREYIIYNPLNWAEDEENPKKLIGTFTMPENTECKWFKTCPMHRFLDMGVLDPKWTDTFCKGDFRPCIRYQMEGRGEFHPDWMLPNGSLDKNLEKICRKEYDEK